MTAKKETHGLFEVIGMQIDVNDDLAIRLLDFCNEEIRAALDDGDLDRHMEEMMEFRKALKNWDEAVLEKHKRHLLAGIMRVAGFKTVSVDWATDWQENGEE